MDVGVRSAIETLLLALAVTGTGKNTLLAKSIDSQLEPNLMPILLVSSSPNHLILSRLSLLPLEFHSL